MNTITIDKDYDPLAWGSHLPALLAAVGASSGPVLEIGVGHFSTPQLHSLCLAMGRKLVSVEEDRNWFEQFAKQYGSSIHPFFYGKYSELVPKFAKDKWGVTFIDHSGDRPGDFKLMFPMSDYVVVHDYHHLYEETIAPQIVGMNHHVTQLYQPPTLIVSQYHNIPNGVCAL